MAGNNKMNKDTVPEGFTVPMALMDLLPVLFFAGTGIMLGLLLNNVFVEICAGIIFLSGLLKAVWKMIAAVKKKNIWPLFMQMRIVMPAGFVLMIIGTVVSLIKIPIGTTAGALFAMPQDLFFGLGIIGLAGMIICAVKFDSSDPKSNWIEQGVNSLAQACFFIGLLIMYLKK